MGECYLSESSSSEIGSGTPMTGRAKKKRASAADCSLEQRILTIGAEPKNFFLEGKRCRICGDEMKRR